MKSNSIAKVLPAMRDRRRRQAARRDVERHVPGVVHPRRLHEPHLAHDLRPQVERGAGVMPRVEGKCGPRCGALDWPIHDAREYPAPAHTTRPRGVDKQAFGRLRQRFSMLVHLGLLQERIARLVPDHEAVVWGERDAHPRPARGAQPAHRERGASPRPRHPRSSATACGRGSRARTTSPSTSTTAPSGSSRCTAC